MRFDHIALLFALALSAQESDRLDHVTVWMRDYARGMTENVFDVQVKISQFTPSGALKRSHNATHRMEFTKGRYRGVAPADATDWESTLFITHAGRATLGLEMFTDMGTWNPVFVFAPGARARKEWVYETPSAHTVAYRSSKTCSTFEDTGKEFRFSHDWCGAGEVTVEESPSVPMRATFHALGLPLVAGKVVLKEYRNESQYQTIKLPGSDQPYVVPLKAIGTFVFQTHTTVVEARYTLRPPKR